MQTNSEGSESDDTEETRPNILKRIEGHIQSKTLAGLLDLVPVLVTVIVVLFLVEKTDALIRPLPFVANEPWDFPGIGLIVGIIVFLSGRHRNIHKLRYETVCFQERVDQPHPRHQGNIRCHSAGHDLFHLAV